MTGNVGLRATLTLKEREECEGNEVNKKKKKTQMHTGKTHTMVQTLITYLFKPEGGARGIKFPND